MHLRRPFRTFFSESSYDAAVVAPGRRKPLHAASSEEGSTPAHAVADDANRADSFQALNCGRDVMHHVIPVEISEIAARVGDFVRRVATLEIAYEAVEHGRRNGGVADRRKAITHCANVAVDAEYLLDHHQAALWRSGGVGAVCAQRVLIGGGQGELLTQRNLPYFF